ncbi:SRPBCC family protein [Pseudonocardia sediminis]|nr:SRPBCC family protein [Pseudonocardia sediminis]
METMNIAARGVIAVDAVVEVDAPAAEAWAVLADYARDVEWRDGVRSMVPTPPGPVRAGTRTAETMRAAGRTLRNDGEVTTVEDGRRFTWRTTSGVRAEGSRAVVPRDGESCRIELTLRVVPPGLLRLVPWAVTGMLRRGLRRDAGRLRAVIELGGHDDRPDGVDLTESGVTSGEDSPSGDTGRSGSFPDW